LVALVALIALATLIALAVTTAAGGLLTGLAVAA
jgi:hypothetical protein